MIYNGPALAQLARDAGFDRDHLPTAIACALASSGGIPTYRHDIGIPGTGRLRGLWALDIDHYHQYADTDLYVPTVAATVAHTLTVETGGWDWCAAYRTDVHAHWLDHASTAATYWQHGPRPSPPVTIFANADRLAVVLDRVRHAHATVDHHVNQVRTLWRTPTPS